MLETNRELGRKLREKDAQLAKMRNNNKELRRVNKMRASPRDCVGSAEELKSKLLDKDKELEVR